MSELFVAPAARADVFAQWDYFAVDVGQPDLADRFIACVELTFTNLGRMPGLGRTRKFRNPKAKNLRSWKVDHFPNHLVFYRLLPDGRGVEIVRVLHGVRDLDALFLE